MTRKLSGRELEQQQQNLEYSKENLKVFLVDIAPLDSENEVNVENRMMELENLVETYSGIVVLKKIQKRRIPDYNTYIGKGKLEEIANEMLLEGANLLIIGNNLKPAQINNINEFLRDFGAKAWDRIDLILKIFERNAKSAEAKLQIELAALDHMGPRIFGMGMELSRQGGGSKLARGKGETNTEIMKRHLKERKRQIKNDLEKYKKERELHRKSRARKGFKSIGIVGYTNAGKSSLLNSLSKKRVLAENKLFATLGTSVGKIWIEPEFLGKEEFETGKEFLMTDTIGFIEDLPPELIEAFSSTLEDSIESDLLLHVIDSDDERIEEKIKIVDEILERIGANQKKIYIFNKSDLLDSDRKIYLKKYFKDLNPIFISAEEKIGFDELKTEIVKNLEK